MSGGAAWRDQPRSAEVGGVACVAACLPSFREESRVRVLIPPPARLPGQAARDVLRSLPQMREGARVELLGLSHSVLTLPASSALKRDACWREARARCPPPRAPLAPARGKRDE